MDINYQQAFKSISTIGRAEPIIRIRNNMVEVTNPLSFEDGLEVWLCNPGHSEKIKIREVDSLTQEIFLETIPSRNDYFLIFAIKE